MESSRQPRWFSESWLARGPSTMFPALCSSKFSPSNVFELISGKTTVKEANKRGVDLNMHPGHEATCI